MERVLPIAALLGAMFLAGCSSVARLENLSEAACSSSFASALSSILIEQGEGPEVAAEFSSQTGALADLGPRPFLVISPSGVDYAFFVELRDGACLLRLYARQKGFVTYSNNLTYIATRDLPGCRCLE